MGTGAIGAEDTRRWRVVSMGAPRARTSWPLTCARYSTTVLSEVVPMQPTLARAPFHRSGWVYERKEDVRACALDECRGLGVRARTHAGTRLPRRPAHRRPPVSGGVGSRF